MVVFSLLYVDLHISYFNLSASRLNLQLISSICVVVLKGFTEKSVEKINSFLMMIGKWQENRRIRCVFNNSTGVEILNSGSFCGCLS